MATLEMLCFDHILWRLEEYKIEELSLLPKKYRVKALLQLPIVDVCRLENTQFTVDIAMDTIWEQLYQKYIGPTANIKRKENWKQLLLSKTVSRIINCGRTFEALLQNIRNSPKEVSTACTSEHPADNVDYLVAMEHCESYIEQEEESMPVYDESNTEAVTLGKTNEQSCENKLAVPSRYTKMLSPGSEPFPNLAALELTQKCGLHLTSLTISMHRANFGAFLVHAQQERPDFIDFLKKFFSSVESVTFCDPQDRNHVLYGAKEVSEASYMELLRQGVKTFITPTLKSISITTVTTLELVKKYAVPALTRMPRCLKTFTTSVLPFCTSYIMIDKPYFEQIESIMLQHDTLEVITFRLIENDNQIFPQHTSISLQSLHSWIEMALANQTLQLLEIYCSETISTEIFLRMLTTFLSVPCFEKQILSLKINSTCNCFEVYYPTKSSQVGNEVLVANCRKIHFTRAQLRSLEEESIQRKAIEFIQYAPFLSKFIPFTIGGLIATRIPSEKIATLLQQFITSEVRINSVDLESFTCLTDYKDLFKGSLLKSMIFSKCWNIVLPLLEQAATEHGFTFEQIMETDYQETVTVESDYQEKFIIEPGSQETVTVHCYKTL